MMNRGGRPPKPGRAALPVSERPRTLASYGITKDQSSKYQKLAAIPDADFEEILQSYKRLSGLNSIPTTIGIIRTWNQLTAKRRPASLERMALELRKAGWVVLPPIGGQEPGESSDGRHILAREGQLGMAFYVSAARRVHILDGDLTGGGHRFGTGKANTTEFPRGWSDDEIIDAIVNVANYPDSPPQKAAKGRLKMIGNRNTVVIVVIVEPISGEIVTGHPL